MQKKHLATVSILVKDRHSQAANVNQILTDHGDLILSRLGVNLCAAHIKEFKNCSALITVIAHGAKKEVDALTDQLDKIYGIVAKSNFLTN